LNQKDVCVGLCVGGRGGGSRFCPVAAPCGEVFDHVSDCKVLRKDASKRNYLSVRKATSLTKPRCCVLHLAHALSQKYILR
jgi:hypothetical protein